MKNIMGIAFSVMVCVVVAAGCSSTVKVDRIDRDKVVDLSGRWNDTDARVASREIIAQCVQAGWVGDFRQREGHKPAVIVGQILNRTDEHIDTLVLTKELEAAVLRAGEVSFVASREERLDVREERNAQNTEGFTRPETIKQIGQETGADFMLIGTVNAVRDEYGNRSVILYQVNMELVDMVTNEKVWFGQHHIKKSVVKKKYSL